MKKSVILLLLLSGMVLSCGTAPTPPEAPSEVVEQEATAPAPEVTVHLEAPAEKPAEAAEEKEFDPTTISAARFQDTKKQLTDFITELNGIIRAKNYDAWVNHLAPSYFTYINSKSFLEDRTEDLYTLDKVVAQNMGRDPKLVEKRVLTSPRDYFNYVVVPSRANDRLDDIAFISDNLVRAYTIGTRGQRLVLYELESINNKWLIAN